MASIDYLTTTIYDLNNDFAGRIGSDGYDGSKRYHIHRRNRAYVWTDDMRRKLLDSILNGYYIPPIICAEIDGKRQILDGGNRITTFRIILEKDVPNLDTKLKQKTVENKQIQVVVMKNLTHADIREQFRRLNKNVKVTSGHLYAMSMDDSPLVKEAISLLEDASHPLRDIITRNFFDTSSQSEKDKDEKSRRNLENAVALISGSLYGKDFITKSFDRQEEKINLSVDRERVVYVLGEVFGIFDKVSAIVPLTDGRRPRGQWPIGKYMAFILYDLLEHPEAAEQKWIDYLVKVRKNEPYAEQASEVKGAQNLNESKLKKVSRRVSFYLKEGRLPIDENDIETDDDDESQH